MVVAVSPLVPLLVSKLLLRKHGYTVQMLLSGDGGHFHSHRCMTESRARKYLYYLTEKGWWGEGAKNGKVVGTKRRRRSEERIGKDNAKRGERLENSSSRGKRGKKRTSRGEKREEIQFKEEEEEEKRKKKCEEE